MTPIPLFLQAAQLLINDQRARLNGYYRFIQPIIEKYKLSVTEIVCPDGIALQPYDLDFRLNDMKNMYQKSLLDMKDFKFRPAIVVYLEIVTQLHQEISDLIKNVDLRHFSEIENLCLQIVQAISTIDPPGKILSPVQELLILLNVEENGGETMIEFIRNMMENYTGDYTYQQGNVINAYIFLYHQIKLLMKILPRLQTLVDKEIKVI
ncbi:MAG: hypothetical protein OXE94_10870 [Aestuariivita sp.]|nr:hypothetical protein [Aestuariivita sp.]